MIRPEMVNKIHQGHAIELNADYIRMAEARLMEPKNAQVELI